MIQMTDETRDEIVRLARKGWTVDKVASWLKDRMLGDVRE